MRHISRWDLDKTYLRTDFETVKDLLRTAFERADEKRTNPGAATLLREMSKMGVSIYILSGSPEQMRRRLEDKLRLDGIRWESFVLKPNLKNMLRLRFRALRDQLGYKLPALLHQRANAGPNADEVRETLFGDDAEADAFVYSLYADIMAGRLKEDLVLEICERGRVYEDVRQEIARQMQSLATSHDVVERVLIHLDQQTPPGDFHVYGPRVVPFYNYLQAAFVLLEDGRLNADGVLRVGAELVTQHRFDGDALARSYGDLVKRGHLRGNRLDDLSRAIDAWQLDTTTTAKEELCAMVDRIGPYAERARKETISSEPAQMPDYLSLVGQHNRRRLRG
ncbi:MAG: hypothetical protein FWD69_01485 [Polyangiaceae bacterium]|nr:hypothetical protein [Polyangiaceae bacterium]